MGFVLFCLSSKRFRRTFSIDRVFEVFYDRVKDIRNYYRKFPELANAPAVDMDIDSGITGILCFSWKTVCDYSFFFFSFLLTFVK